MRRSPYRFPSAEGVDTGLWGLTRSFAFKLAAISDDMLVIDQQAHPDLLLTPMDFTVAPASLSRHLNSVAPPPRLFHSVYQPNSSILCLAAAESYIFGGRQSGDILVLCILRLSHSFILKQNLRYLGLGS